ncbi:MAG: N-acetylneuraminate synthase family protein, partial [Bacteroidales bacterium]|nr:N-acetylneuraminate synthase family protein [Bacteroidales bacterium]
MFKENGVYIIAELSANHNQSFDIAIKTIKAMKTAGADAVKLQTFSPESMTMNTEQPWFQTRKDSHWSGQKLYDLY